MLLGITPITNQLLLPAAKMLYSLSKDSDNDGRFHQQVSLQSLLRVTSTLSGALQQQQKHIGAALLYCSGCLKNISTASANQQSLGQLGGVSIMAQVSEGQCMWSV